MNQWSKMNESLPDMTLKDFVRC